MDDQKRVDYIFKLSEDWLHQVLKPNGEGVHNLDSYKLSLHRNLDFHTLSNNEALAVCTALINKLHYRNLGAYIDADQMVFWSWIGQLFCEPEARKILNLDTEAYNHFTHVIIPIILIKDKTLFDSPIGKDCQVDPNYDFHLREFLTSRWSILKYLSYPLLESVTRKLCEIYVDSYGTVLLEFAIPQKNGSQRKYRAGKKCSSLRDLLILMETSVASNELKFFMINVKDTITRITGHPEPYDILYSWRNETLHGNKFSGISGPLFLNLSILFMLELIRNEYSKLIEKAYSTYNNSKSSKIRLNAIYYDL